MKKFALLLFLFAVLFAGAFAVARYGLDRQWPEKWTAKQEESPPLDFGFRPNPYAAEDRPFAVVIVGLNNGAAVEKTLQSVFSQKYENFRVIYIDDGSDDGSYELARDLIYDSPHIGRVNLIKNEQRLGAVANLVRAVQACADGEIVVVLDGEDWLAHEWVLQRLNAYYADPDLWITFGQYRDYPTYELGVCRSVAAAEVGDKGWRSLPFVSSHLKTFYAGLFKKVKEEDLTYQGQYFSLGGEMAYMAPMLEMASGHFHFIPEILYIRNRQAALKEEKEWQARCEKCVRGLAPYPTLAHLSLTQRDEGR